MKKHEQNTFKYQNQCLHPYIVIILLFYYGSGNYIFQHINEF